MVEKSVIKLEFQANLNYPNGDYPEPQPPAEGLAHFAREQLIPLSWNLFPRDDAHSFGEWREHLGTLSTGCDNCVDSLASTCYASSASLFPLCGCPVRVAIYTLAAGTREGSTPPFRTRGARG